MLQILSVQAHGILHGDLRGESLHIDLFYLLNNACLWLEPFIKDIQMLDNFVKSASSALSLEP